MEPDHNSQLYKMVKTNYDFAQADLVKYDTHTEEALRVEISMLETGREKLEELLKKMEEAKAAQ